MAHETNQSQRKRECSASAALSLALSVLPSCAASHAEVETQTTSVRPEILVEAEEQHGKVHHLPAGVYRVRATGRTICSWALISGPEGSDRIKNGLPVEALLMRVGNTVLQYTPGVQILHAGGPITLWIHDLPGRYRDSAGSYHVVFDQMNKQAGNTRDR